MKKILLFGAGKSASSLIEYLSRICQKRSWTCTVVDSNWENLKIRIPASLGGIDPVVIKVEDKDKRSLLIQSADIVISLLPPSLHILVAEDCVRWSKNLLTASYIDKKIRALESTIKDKQIFFLCEMGLDPGIDHMSAMQIIHRIQRLGGKIKSFKSHTGGLVAPESDDNLWHYKISWNPANIVSAGSAGAVYKENGQIRVLDYQQVFQNTTSIKIEPLGSYAYYPNRNSLDYMPVYGLENIDTFIRSTLRHPDFCKGWKAIVAAGLTEDKPIESSVKTISEWSKPILKFVDPFNKALFNELGLFENTPVPEGVARSSQLLQWVIENRWKMHLHDKDMIVMLHEFEYNLANEMHGLNSTLIVKGDNAYKTAMSKTVGLPLGIAAKMVLENKIQLSGVHIPILPEIYEPVLTELEKEGICFNEKVS